MKRLPLFVCLVLLLLVVTVIPVTASPEIYSISPATAPNTGDVTVTITGTGFNSESTVFVAANSTGSVIHGTVVSWSPTSITCTFSLNGQTPAKFNVVVNSPLTDPTGHYWPKDNGFLSEAFEVYQGTGMTAMTTTVPVATTAPETTPLPTTAATVQKTVSPLGTELGIIAILGTALLLIKRK